uniref:Uncharacterized protein n=1 Tax=Astyanax mexicanus TaxID=7994 RepID=A0A3B1K605_ASTMX
MPFWSMTDTLRLPSLQVHVPQDDPDGLAWSSSSTPTLRRRRFKMRRTKKVPSERERLENGLLRHPGSRSASKEYLQLPSIEITPSSDEDLPWSNCSTPSASPRRKRFLLRKWLKVREKKEIGSESRLVFDGHTNTVFLNFYYEKSTASILLGIPQLHYIQYIPD